MEEKRRKDEQKRLEEEERKKQNDLENFYDLILHFNSFEQLKKEGWKACFTKLGKERYDKCINENNIVIGIIGNKNRGKSYLLGRIMKMKDDFNPNGFLLTTLGISCMFPSIANKNFVILDTAGMDNPLIQNIFFDELEKKTKKNELIKNVIRDQKVTEIALNEFIIQESNVIIAVVEQLSLAEQDMLKNLLNTLKKYQRKKANSKDPNTWPKRLIVIHNLMNLSSEESIYKFIEETLKKSLTFSLSTQTMSIECKDNQKVYPQINCEDDIQIIHVVVGDDGNEKIRKEFNEPAFNYIRKNIITSEAKKFNIIESFKNFIIENSQNYIDSEKLESDSLIIGESSENNNKIILPITINKKIEKLNLKRIFINPSGIQTFSYAIEPLYSINLIEINGKDYIEIEFEIYGKIDINNLNIEKNIAPTQYIISVKGKTKKVLDDDNEDEDLILEGNLEFTEFEFQVLIKRYLPFQSQEMEKEKEKHSNEEIEIILLNESEIKEEDPEYGIYKIKFPYKKNILTNSDDENED